MPLLFSADLTPGGKPLSAETPGHTIALHPQTHGRARVEKFAGPESSLQIAVETDDATWSYAVSFAFHALQSMDGFNEPRVIVDLEVETGALGVGCTTADYLSYVDREVFVAAGMRRKVYVPIGVPGAALHLMLRNADPNGRSAALIHSIEIRRATAEEEIAEYLRLSGPIGLAVAHGGTIVQALGPPLSLPNFQPVVIETDVAISSNAAGFGLTMPLALAGAGERRVVIDLEVAAGAVGVGCTTADYSSYVDRELFVALGVRRKVYVPIGAPGAASHLLVRNANPDGRSVVRIHSIEIRRVTGEEEIAEQLRLSGPIGLAVPHGGTMVRAFGPRVSPPDFQPTVVETDVKVSSTAATFGLTMPPALNGIGELRVVIDLEVEAGAVGVGCTTADYSSYVDREVFVPSGIWRKVYVPIGMPGAASHLMLRNANPDDRSVARIHNIQIRRVTAAEEIQEHLRCSGPVGLSVPHGEAIVRMFGPRILPPDFQPIVVETDVKVSSNAATLGLTMPLQLAGEGEPRVVIDLEVEAGAIGVGCTTADYSSYVDRELFAAAGMRRRVYVPIGVPGAATHLMLRNANPDGRSVARIHDVEIRRVTAAEEIQEHLRCSGPVGLAVPHGGSVVTAFGPHLPQPNFQPVVVETDMAISSNAAGFGLTMPLELAGAGEPRVVVDLEIEGGALGIGCTTADCSSYVDRELFAAMGIRRKVYVPIGAPGAASHLMLRNANPDGRSVARVHNIEIRRVTAAEEIAEYLRFWGPIGLVVPHGGTIVQAFGPRISPPGFQPIVIETDIEISSNAATFDLTMPPPSNGAGKPWIVIDLEVEVGALGIGCTTPDYLTYVDREVFVPSGIRHKAFVPIGAPGAASHLMLRNANSDGYSVARIHKIVVQRIEVIQAKRDKQTISPGTEKYAWRETGERSHDVLPLYGLRLVATLPPKYFFGGSNLLRAHEQIEALRSLGAVVYEFDTAAVYDNDRAKIERQQRDIIEFRPDAAISTPNAGFIVQGCMLTYSTDLPGGRTHNLLIDELELPVVLFWDHASVQAAQYLLRPWPERPCESQSGARQRLADLFTHPRIVHFFPDSAHAQALGSLGIGAPADDTWYVPGAGRIFLKSDLRTEDGDGFDEDVAFFGNLYLAASNQIPYAADSALMRLRDQARTLCAADWSLSAWQAYLQAMAALDPDERAALRLVPDQSFFWRFLCDEISCFMNGEARWRMLQSCGREVACFGNFNDPLSAALMTGKFRLRGALPYDGALAEAFRRTRVTVDAANAGFINGFSVKLLNCFAAGGFALTNRKADIARAFGALADEICCDSADSFAGKLEFFLGHDRRRLEVSREIGAIVRRDYSAETLFARTLPAAVERLKAH